jgi:hypothetical protein
MTMRLDIDWLPSPGVEDPAESATWAEISLKLRGEVVSRVLDERLNAGRNGFFTSALPLAEWLVDAWPRLVHERRTPVSLREALTLDAGKGDPSAGIPREGFFEWVGYHSMRAAREGGAMPDARIVRFDSDSFAVRMNPDLGSLAPGVTVRFIAGAEARVPAGDVKAELHRVVESVLARLHEVKSERVERLLGRWRVTQSEAAMVAGRLGVDDESLRPEEHAVIQDVLSDASREVLLGIAEGSAAPSLSVRVSEALAVRGEEPPSVPAAKPWARLEEALHRVRLDRPWLTGWAAASEFRTAIGLTSLDTPARRFPALLSDRCGWPEQRQVAALRAPPTGVDTVHLKRSNQLPIVMTATTTAQAHSFRLARSLYYFLFLGGGGDRAISDSRMIQGRLSEANAFAAELLAPADVIRAHTPPSRVWTRQQRQIVAETLGVDQRIVAHQIENRDLGLSD